MFYDVAKVLDSLSVDYDEVGERYMVSCPIHNDQNPSCGIWIDSGYFRCFGCGAEGSLVDFYAEVSGLPIVLAKRKMRTCLCRSVDDVLAQMAKALDLREAEFQYMSWKSFCRVFPPVQVGTQAWDYLKSRKLSDKTIKQFRIRWGGSRGKYVDRVILPIITVDRKLLAYVGRAIHTDTVPKTRKNRSPHRTFFGLAELLERWPECDCLVVVEGEFDAVYLQQCGIPAVANMGTVPFNSYKLRLLRKYSRRRVVISYDGDEAGQKGMFGSERTEGAVSMVSGHLPVTTVLLPEGKDPNKLSKSEVLSLYGEWRQSCLIS
jgi:DNA primase